MPRWASHEDIHYASAAYRAALDELGIVCSMSRKGNCWDNAVSESFFSTLERELIYRHEWATRDAATFAVAECIVCFYNTRRRHSSLAFNAPTEHGKIYASRPIAA